MARQGGDVATAIGYYERAIEQGPATWAAFFNLGLMYRDVGRTDDAMGALSRALQGAPPEEAPRVQAAIEELLKTPAGAAP